MPPAISRLLLSSFLVTSVVIFAATPVQAADKKPKAPPEFQYSHGEINIPAATSDEKLRQEFSLEHALAYLDKGAQAWTRVVELRACGVPSDDARIRKSISWLLANQRESGRWWTRSLNTDKYHFITYSGTCYPLLALAKCGALPEKGAE